MTVQIERQAHVWTIVIDRPQARNAVDRPTAAALADACRTFEADGSARVAVLSGPTPRSVPERTSRRCRTGSTPT